MIWEIILKLGIPYMAETPENEWLHVWCFRNMIWMYLILQQHAGFSMSRETWVRASKKHTEYKDKQRTCRLREDSYIYSYVKIVLIISLTSIS